MKLPVKNLLVYGAAILLGSAGLASALPVKHDMTLRLPNGGLERIAYSGNVAPKITIVPEEEMFFVPAGVWWSVPSLDSVSSDLQGIDAAMNQHLVATLQEMNRLTATSPKNINESVQPMPAGSEDFAIVTTTNGHQGCTREMQIIGLGLGKTPKIVSHSSGDCAGVAAPSGSTGLGPHFTQVVDREVVG
jgi:hypothetical protein